MILTLRQKTFLIACSAWMCVAATTSRAETIMKLNLDGNGANFGFSSGMLSAIDDGVSATPGSRNASIEYPAASQSFAAITEPSVSSFTLTGITASSQARTLGGSLVVQSFDSGNLAIFGNDNSLLLSANISLSAITSPLGPPSTQGLFLAFGELTGGSMARRLDRESLRIKMKLPTVTNGFSVSPLPTAPAPPVYYANLNDFTAMTLSIEILAEVVPEPTSGLLLTIAGLAVFAGRRRRH